MWMVKVFVGVMMTSHAMVSYAIAKAPTAIVGAHVGGPAGIHTGIHTSLRADSTPAVAVVSDLGTSDSGDVSLLRATVPRVTFETYSSPSECIAALQRDSRLPEEAGYKGRPWQIAKATVETPAGYDPAGDTVYAVVRTDARACLSHFPLAAVRDWQLAPMVVLAAVADDSTTARAAFTRLMRAEATRTPRERALTFHDLIATIGVGRSEARFSERTQRWVLECRDSLQSLWRATTHGKTPPDADFLYDIAQQQEQLINGFSWQTALSDPAFARQVEIASAAIAAVPDERRAKLSEVLDEDVGAMVIVVGSLYGADSLQTILPKFTHNVQQLADTALWTRVLGLLASRAQFAAQFLGQPRPPLTGTYWVGLPPESVRPARGRVTLVQFNALTTTEPLLTRLHQRFGDSLDIILVAGLSGWFQREAPLSPDAEVAMQTRWVREYVGVPFPIVFSPRPYTVRPAPDGRREYGAEINATRYGLSLPVVVDKRGIVRAVVLQLPGSYPALEQQIAKLIAEPAP
jgi:hypothetical protein